MRGEFPDDEFTENEVLLCLDAAGLRYKNGARYILSQCPTHEDQHPSVQIYKDDWFVNCHAGCGRYHITKAFPELRPDNSSRETGRYAHPAKKAKPMSEPKYKTYNLMDEWRTMPLIPRDHVFKKIPLEILDSLGWRWDAKLQSYFIPYFSRSKDTIPFAQWRHLVGDRRFTFLKEARPTCYGTWNLLPGEKIFVVEGTSDCAVLEYCGVPWIGLPSAASGALLKAMAGFCIENDISIVYAGDNDSAGSKLLQALDEVATYRRRQPPKQYKDYGDFFVAEGFDAVVDWCYKELFPGQYIPPLPEVTEKEKRLANVQSVFPGAEQLEIVGS